MYKCFSAYCLFAASYSSSATSGQLSWYTQPWCHFRAVAAADRLHERTDNTIAASYSPTTSNLSNFCICAPTRRTFAGAQMSRSSHSKCRFRIHLRWAWGNKKVGNRMGFTTTSSKKNPSGCIQLLRPALPMNLEYVVMSLSLHVKSFSSSSSRSPLIYDSKELLMLVWLLLFVSTQAPRKYLTHLWSMQTNKHSLHLLKSSIHNQPYSQYVSHTNMNIIYLTKVPDQAAIP